ncbi:SAFB-like transcription modulator isoform X2 [Acipenser ruthenus]|uniref:SAFB-like transcription modulator isoform X2 n=2 Tax=Acipenser ruthenus TaxID=7906 RepID=UPI00145AFBB0|nr:SAFB-like transcription modulator isoform X2 [Acipenser ruthenus]
MASAGVLTETKKITELRVIDLKTELKRRNLDVTGVKNVLVARLKQAIEKEGGDTDNIEITLSSDTPTKRTPKAKGKKQDADADATMEEESFSKEAESLDQNGSDDPKDLEDSGDGEDENVNSSFEILESNPDSDASESKVEMEYLVKEVDEEESRELLSDNDGHVITDEAEDEDNEKDITDTDDGSYEKSKHLPSEESLAEAEQAAQAEREATASGKEAEDDNISVTIQAEDAITLDLDGDDLLDTGKNVKLPDSEASKAHDEPSASAQMSEEQGKDVDAKEKHKDGKKDDGLKAEPPKKETREGSKKAELGDKEKDSVKKGPSSTGASSQAKSSTKDNKDGKATTKDEKGGTSGSAGGSSGSTSGSSRNLWVSGLSSNTKAADLKNLFGKYGKVLSAKVVTNARSPGAKCYGIVTMSSSAEVARCISHIHRTELHGQQISVEKVKSDPFKKESAKKESEDKTSSSKTSGEKRTTTNVKSQTKTQVSSKKEEKKSEKSDKESKEVTKKQEAKDEKTETKSGSGQASSKKDDKKRGSTKSPGKMVVIDQTKGDPVNRQRPPMRRGRFDKVHPNMMPRRTRTFFPPEEVAILRNKGKFFPNNFRGGRQDILPFEKMKEQKMRDRLVRLERIHRAVELRRRREIAERERRERERIQMLREREERERLQRERERLEIERQKLERERMERERLERERIRIEQERRKEAERIAREREELRRQQEQLRYEQEKRNTLKRARDVDHRRDDPYWNGNKKIETDTDVRLNHGSEYNRQQNRFNDFSHRERGRYTEGSSVQPSAFERRDHFESEQDGKKSRPAARRESSGFDNRYTKNYDARRTEQPRTEIHDTDRRVIRDRDERRVVPIPERPAGNRGHPTERGRIAEIPHGRSTRESGPGGWKNEVIGEAKGDIRAAVRMRPERSGRDGLGPSVRGGTSATRSRDGGRGMVIGERVSSSTSFRPTQQKNYSEGRQVVVERHGRDQGPRKDWHGTGSQGSGYQGTRRMGESRGSMMSQHSSHSPPAMNRIVQINNTMQGGSGSGYKPFKGGAPRRF